MRLHYKMVVTALTVTVLACRLMAGAAPDNITPAAALSAAICPIVYPVDQTTSGRGDRYFFFGNAFFINEQGYLITAAHVVNSFREGGRPHILIGAPGEPRRLLEATLVGADWLHDVAVLRATPNPFDGEHKPAFLSLATETPTPGKSVLAVAQHPAAPQGGYTVEEPSEERLSGEVLNLHFTKAETGVGDSELLLLSQEVVPGYSGSPVVSADSQDVVGIVVGRWLRPGVIPLGSTTAAVPAAPGAALRIHYAIALLRELGIPWHMAPGSSEPAEYKQESAEPAKGFSAPVPLSVVATPYPPQALFGGEVSLDALIDASGRVTELEGGAGRSAFSRDGAGRGAHMEFLARPHGRTRGGGKNRNRVPVSAVVSAPADLAGAQVRRAIARFG